MFFPLKAVEILTAENRVRVPTMHFFIYFTHTYI